MSSDYLPNYRNEEWLQARADEGLTFGEIHALCDRVSENTLRTWLRKFDIQYERGGTGGFERYEVPEWVTDLSPADLRNDRETLYEVYWGEQIGVVKIASTVGRAKTTVRRWLSKHDIPTRPGMGSAPDMWTYDGNGRAVWVGPQPALDDTEIPEPEKTDEHVPVWQSSRASADD